MISWITSAATLLAVWLNGRNVRLSWKVSLLNQAIWLVFIVKYDAWGLLPLTLALSAIFAGHLRRTRCASGRRLLSDQPSRDDGPPVSTDTTCSAGVTSGHHNAGALDRSRSRASAPSHGEAAESPGLQLPDQAAAASSTRGAVGISCR